MRLTGIVKHTMKSVGKTATTLAAAGYLALAPAASAEEAGPEPPQASKQLVAAGDAEIMASNIDFTLDTKILVKLSPYVSISDRNRLTMDYAGNTSGFHYMTLDAKILEGFTVGPGFWGDPTKSVSPHIAAHYVKNHKGFSMLQVLSSTIGDDPTGLSLTRLTYRHTIKGHIESVTGFENVTLFGYWNHKLSIQRFRQGIGYRNFHAGIAADLCEKGPGGRGGIDFNWKVGAYTSVQFKAFTR
ncbi:hypothetical protein KY362_08255 [Candidatus Woesearchaeota archaeon]|nr:hypothetical protein [Candidatus Woesearchaeota archaeon]